MRLKVRKGKGGNHESGEANGGFGGGRIKEVLRVGGDKGPQSGQVDGRAGYDRVRDSRGRARSHRDSGDHGVQAEIAGALERDSRRHKRLVDLAVGRASSLAPWVPRGCSRAQGWEQSGQSTVEFAVIAAGFLSLTVALASLWHLFDGGIIVEHALSVASHHIQAVAPATIADLFLY